MEARSLRGRAYVKLGYNNNAIEDLGKYLNERPDDVQALISRGAAWTRAGNGVVGIRDFDKALKIDPNLPVAHFNKAAIYLFYENYDEAIDNFDLAIENKPDYVEAYTRRGMAKLNSSFHSLASACADLKKAHEMDDELATANLNAYCK